MLAGCVGWPEDLSARYRERGYWRNELLGDLLDPWAQRAGSRVALVSEREALTYAELNALVTRLASELRRRGLTRNDRVVLQLPNDVLFAAMSLALFKLGVTPVFALAAHRRHEILHLCNHTGAVGYVMPGFHQGFEYRSLAEEVKASAPELRLVISADEAESWMRSRDPRDEPTPDLPALDPSDVAFFLLSGGTTSTPKLIPRTHQDYAYQLRASAAALGVDERSVYLASLPAAHNAALGCPGVLGTLRAGGKVVMASSPSPGDVFPLIERERVTFTTLMPSILKLWIEMTDFLPADLSGILFQVGGAWLDPDVARAVSSKLGARLTHWFGMAEGFLSHTRLDDPEECIVHSTGRPLCPDDEIRVVDESDRDVPAGETGELLVRGPYTLRGYYNAFDYNRTAFTTDGYLRTGDLVRITGRGDMVVEGRIKDVVNRGGEKVSAEELEQQLIMHPDVRNAAVVAMPDAALVEKTCAFVVPGSHEPNAPELRRFLLDSGLAEYKLPDHIEIVDALPFTSLGKIDKRQLRERVGASSPRAHAGRTAEAHRTEDGS